MVDGVEVAIDGNTATLVDLSIIGAQVVSPTILKPNQRLRMALAEGSGRSDSVPVLRGRHSSWRSRGPSTAPASSSSTPSPTHGRATFTEATENEAAKSGFDLVF